MKTNILIICWIFFTLVSCQNKDEIVQNINKIELTQEEYTSIAYDNPKEIEATDVLKLVDDFTHSLNRTRSNTITRNIKNKFYITQDANGVITKGKTRGISDLAIPIYQIELKSDTLTGYSLVSADGRYPTVLTYIPTTSKFRYTQSIGAECMNEIAEKTVLTSIACIEAIKDSLRYKTLLKLAKILNREVEDISFNNIKNSIQIKRNYETRSEVDFFPSQGTYQYGLTPRIAVNWSQDAPFNRKLKQACSYDEISEGRYAAGCVVVCLAQILSYFEPNMFADGITIDWKLLKSSPYITTASSSTKINQVSTLMKFIGNRTNTSYSCDEGGSTNTEKAVTQFLPLFNIIADSKSGWNSEKVKSSIGRSESTFRPVIVTGKCDYGSHAWILDGFQVRKDTATGIESYYSHANMGWEGTDNGYFLLENNMTFKCYYNPYHFNRSISIYTNIRKK